MRPKKYLYRCHNSVYDEARDDKCVQFRTEYQCPECEGQDVYVLKSTQKPKKARKP